MHHYKNQRDLQPPDQEMIRQLNQTILTMQDLDQSKLRRHYPGGPEVPVRVHPLPP